VSHTDADLNTLAAQATAAAARAYAPYSQFRVGAALRTEGGETYLGCNIENASFGVTICAERVAAATAVAAGARDWKMMAIATVGGAAPCGLCRQFLIEFAPQLTLLLVDRDAGERRLCHLSDLLPDYFSGGDIPSRPATDETR
jgi:cytidine deaminase